MTTYYGVVLLLVIFHQDMFAMYGMGFGMFGEALYHRLRH